MHNVCGCLAGSHCPEVVCKGPSLHRGAVWADGRGQSHRHDLGRCAQGVARAGVAGVGEAAPAQDITQRPRIGDALTGSEYPPGAEEPGTRPRP